MQGSAQPKISYSFTPPNRPASCIADLSPIPQQLRNQFATHESHEDLKIKKQGWFELKAQNDMHIHWILFK